MDQSTFLKRAIDEISNNDLWVSDELDIEADLVSARVDMGNRDFMVMKANAHGYFVSLVIDYLDCDISIYADNPTTKDTFHMAVPYNDFPMSETKANEAATELFKEAMKRAEKGYNVH